MKFIKPILIFFVVLINAQSGFQILDNKKKIEIPFRQINNLTFIDLKINNVDLTFLLDTGVAETLLFSLENKEISFENVEKVNFTGLGGSSYIEGIKSSKNTLVIDKNFIDDNHTLYIILDEKVAMLHLKKIGVELETLSPDQAKYIGVEVEGPYKPEYYRY